MSLPLWIVICIMKKYEDYWYIFFFIAYHDKSWSTRIYHERSWRLLKQIWSFTLYHDMTTAYGKSYKVSWRIMICHDLHRNISERYLILITWLNIQPASLYQVSNDSGPKDYQFLLFSVCVYARSGLTADARIIQQSTGDLGYGRGTGS